MHSTSYNIISRLGGGATSEVFLVVDPKLHDKPFVVKRLAPHLRDNTGYLNLFEHEALLLGALKHEGIPHLIDFIEPADAPEIHMQFIPGRSLFAVLQEIRKLKETLSLERARRILGGLLDIMAHIHESCAPDGRRLEVLHRDICPVNIIVGPHDRMTLIDFGSASSVLLENPPQDALFGRFSYLAPERVQGGRATASGDIFSLGIVAYELFCGVHPFRAHCAEATMNNIENGSCMSPGCARPGLPAAIERFIECLLRVDVEERCPSARAALEALNSL